MDNIVMKILKVDGMTCSMCEKAIENTLKKLDGVKKVKASYKNKTVMIKYDKNKIDQKLIASSLDKEGYIIITDSNNRVVIIAFIIMFGLYLIFKNTNLFYFVPEIKDNIGYGLLFIVGLLTSIHCIAMCGGINISVSMDRKFKSGFLYNLGRVTSYTIIGGIVGGIGSTIAINDTIKDIISIVAGIFMIVMGLNMTNIFKSNFINIHIPKFIGRFINKNKKNANSPFIIGMLNGLMPCGPLQTMQLYALGTGSILKGALSMFFFSLGTTPLMLGLSTLSSFISGKMGVQLKKISGVLVVFLGIIMFNRGFDYTSITNLKEPSFDPKKVTIAVIKDGYQEVTTRFENGRYKPIVVEKGIPVRWTIVIEDGDLNGCNNSIIIKEYNLQKDLDYGDNLVIFTPNDIGKFKYTCWMRMIASSIYVVDDIETINK